MSHVKSESERTTTRPGMSRRVFLHRGTAMIGGAALATTFLGCGSSEPEGFTCATGLLPQQVTMRQNMSYTDMGTDPSKLCKDCSFFPANAPLTACSECTLQLGAVHPLGNCTSFAARPS